jgi:hypothetical protein
VKVPKKTLKNTSFFDNFYKKRLYIISGGTSFSPLRRRTGSFAPQAGWWMIKISAIYFTGIKFSRTIPGPASCVSSWGRLTCHSVVVHIHTGR